MGGLVVPLGEDAVFPLWVKLLCSAWVVVLVPVYWRCYGPSNFLWFSDIALFVGVAALWLEDAFLASTQALSVGVLELIWLADFLAHLNLGRGVVGLSGYMFDARIPRFLRGLSLFHVWLPPLLFGMVWVLGYDARALPAWTALAWAVLLVCYLFTDPAKNINWVFGPGVSAQTWTSPGVYFVIVLLGFPLGVYLPTHLVLTLLAPAAEPAPLWP
jgi:hypothetical protein